jgi:hypothetical protein
MWPFGKCKDSLRPVSLAVWWLLSAGSFTMSMQSAQAELLCDGHPMPPGKVCCRGGRYCEPGNVCADGGMKCVSRSSPGVCSDGKSVCEKGSVCTPQGGCIAATSERYCGGRKFCAPGFACIAGDKCLSVTSDRYCGGGKYCNEGYKCAGNGKCTSVAASPPAALPRFGTNSESGSGGGKATISDSCLSVGEPKEVTGSIGACKNSNGTKGHWYFTMVRSTLASGCPREIDFDYLDPDGSVPQFSTPFNVQTCGAPPAAIGVVNK